MKPTGNRPKPSLPKTGSISKPKMNKTRPGAKHKSMKFGKR